MKLSKKTRGELDRLITVCEAARRIGVTPTRVRQWIRVGALEAVFGRVDPVDLATFKNQPAGRGRPRKGVL